MTQQGREKAFLDERSGFDGCMSRTYEKKARELRFVPSFVREGSAVKLLEFRQAVGEGGPCRSVSSFTAGQLELLKEIHYASVYSASAWSYRR